MSYASNRDFGMGDRKIMTSPVEKISFVEKIIANIKGNILGSTLNQKEYYYLTFGCETSDDIDLIKSMTPDECKYFLDCCWYLGIDHTAEFTLTFMKSYRKFYRGVK